MKKIGKTTRPFGYDLNQIPYDYTVEVRNRFKGLDLIDKVPPELWREVHDIVQETGIKTVPMENIHTTTYKIEDQKGPIVSTGNYTQYLIITIMEKNLKEIIYIKIILLYTQN